jgi:hypothetical protein
MNCLVTIETGKAVNSILKYEELVMVKIHIKRRKAENFLSTEHVNFIQTTLAIEKQLIALRRKQQPSSKNRH